MSGLKNSGGLKAAIATAALVGAMALTSPAFAGQITISNVEIPIGEDVVLNSNLNNLPNGQKSQTEFGGQFVLTTDSGTLYAWCVDLFDGISTGPRGTFRNPDLTYTTGSLTNDSNGHTLTATQISQIAYLADLGDHLLANPSTPNKDTVSAAIQAEIWDVEYGFNEATSPLTCLHYHNRMCTSWGAKDTNFAAEMVNLSNLVSVPANYANYGGYTIADESKNGQCGGTCQTLFVATGPTGHKVPEPATFAVFGAGLLGFGALRRQLKKKAA